jgi:phage FluMu protein Com
MNTGGVSCIYSKEDTEKDKEIIEFIINLPKQKKYDENKVVFQKCPICKTFNPIYDTSEIRCDTCKCILSMNNEYVANEKIDLPWGIRL